jgi:hypothetical protein
MPLSPASIHHSLRLVQDERTRRAATAGLAERVQAIKAYQQQRFAHTYADMLASERYRPASQFFLDELYGPGDFHVRDQQFARVVPTLTRIFPTDIVRTVAMLAQLHALSERLDSAMGDVLDHQPVTALAYALAWQATGHRSDRTEQIALTVRVAGSLDLITQRRWIRGSLRLMRTAAQAAGLGKLQAFLEAGFDAFKAMDGAAGFIAAIEQREQLLANALFDADIKLKRASALPPDLMVLLPPDDPSRG